MTLKEFMAELNSIVETKFEEDRTDTWYSYRGVEILKDGVGITGYTSVDESTSSRHPHHSERIEDRREGVSNGRTS